MKTNNRAIALACDQAGEVCELTPPSNTEVTIGHAPELLTALKQMCDLYPPTTAALAAMDRAAALSQTSKEKQ